ncbi:MAG: hypothetical protein DI528_12815 [Shinella sp.]|nr:MAG: hypothetical protein DI528_12815 [Shinella sp.]
MSALATILIGAATKVGANVVKGILEKHVGGAAGDIGGTVIDAIARQAGVEPDALPNLPPPQIEDAVNRVEADWSPIITAEIERQRETNKLMLAEMEKATPESQWTWSWRPAGMWLMLACIAWYVMLRPVFNAALKAAGSATEIEIGIDVATFLGLFTIYTGLYMGGNTLLRTVKK